MFWSCGGVKALPTCGRHFAQRAVVAENFQVTEMAVESVLVFEDWKLVYTCTHLHMSQSAK